MKKIFSVFLEFFSDISSQLITHNLFSGMMKCSLFDRKRGAGFSIFSKLDRERPNRDLQREGRCFCVSCCRVEFSLQNFRKVEKIFFFFPFSLNYFRKYTSNSDSASRNTQDLAILPLGGLVTGTSYTVPNFIMFYYENIIARRIVFLTVA